MTEEFKPVEIGAVDANGKLTLRKPGARLDGNYLLQMLRAMPAPGSARALGDIVEERASNVARWGEQNYPSSASLGGPGACLLYGIPTERAAKETVARATKEGRLTWADVLLEEFAEAVAATDDVARRGELVQVAAVALAWIECIDRRSAADMAGFDALRASEVQS